MPKAKSPARKRGRPRLPAGQVKRFPLNMRTTRETRQKIEAAAKGSGRSLAQQVEWLVEKALADEEAKYNEFGGHEYYRLGLLLACAVQEGELISGKRWFETRRSIDKTAAFVVSFLDGYGRTFGKGPGTTSEIDPIERVRKLKQDAKQLRRDAPTGDKEPSG